MLSGFSSCPVRSLESGLQNVAALLQMCNAWLTNRPRFALHRASQCVAPQGRTPVATSRTRCAGNALASLPSGCPVKRSAIIAVVGLATSIGYAPVLVGGLIWKSSKSRQEHERWSEDFRQTNERRVNRGLKPLDWCIEAVHFDKGWAHEDPTCGPRIDRAESGDTLALAYPRDFYQAKPDSSK